LNIDLFDNHNKIRDPKIHFSRKKLVMQDLSY